MGPYRLALDIGTNSIGWCALTLGEGEKRLTPRGILDMGVRIFPDGRNPKNGTSNASIRRMARGMRRNRDRFLERRNRLLEALVAVGLLPPKEADRKALTRLDPYELRARGLDERLETFELGRAIFHLNQRRGFKSNRKSDASEKDAGAIKLAIRELDEKMKEADARTFGEFLYRRRTEGLPVRARLLTRPPQSPNSRKKDEEFYEFYPAREAIEAEFDALWAAQKPHHPTVLTDDARQRIHRRIFHQRPLKEPQVGRCALVPEEERLPWAYPLAQQLRIYQEVNNLGVIDPVTLARRDLLPDERDRILKKLCNPAPRKGQTAEVKFDTLRECLEPHSKNARFTHESEKRNSLEGDTVSSLLSHPTRFGPRWYALSDGERENAIGMLLNESDEEALLEMLIADFGLDREHAQAAANTPLPPGHARRGRTAATRILAELKADNISEYEAVVRAGFTPPASVAHGQARDRLPYYGEVLERHVIPHLEKHGHPAAPLEEKFGKVGNPTVHIALNQVRKVVNEIIKLHGKPAEIHVEVLRELKNSLKKRKEIIQEQAKNKAENDRCAKRLREEFKETVNRENIQRVRLWEEMGADDCLCVYSGETIPAHRLFSAEIEIDHILPWSRTLDDSMANKILCVRRANRDKTNRTPFEAWGSTPGYPEILARSQILPGNKRWRFAEDAMERFLKENDFLKRQLTDSQYIATLARTYLAALYPVEQAHKVVCLPGRLTGLFRHHLGLASILEEVNPALAESPLPKGEKNRNDHRHHAVDALVVGVMDRAFLQRAASISARLEEKGVRDFLSGFDAPWPGFHAEARDALAGIVVSHKADHGVQGELHNQTAYGIAHGDPRGNAVHRVPVKDLKDTHILAMKGRDLRAELIAHLAGVSRKEAVKILQEYDDKGNSRAVGLHTICKRDKKDAGALVERAKAWLAAREIRRVRVVERIDLIPIADRNGKEYKGFKPDSNAYMEIWEKSPGSWDDDMIRTFDANNRHIPETPGQRETPLNGGRTIARLFNRDMVEMKHQGMIRIYVVQRLSKGQITLAEHYEANVDGRNRDSDDPFKFVYKGSAEALRKAGVRFLVVSPAGRIRYVSGERDDTSGAGDNG